MWAVYLACFVLAVVRAAKLQYCQELILRGSALRKDVATIVFTVDVTCAMCYREVQKLVTLKRQMAKLGHNADILVALDRLPRDHKHELPSEVTVDLEDAWTKLGQLNGHIFVFDKCGKLAYQVITPWSRQMYPFTAMAGLSALYDAPCGECNVTSQVIAELQDEHLRNKSDQAQRNQPQEILKDSEGVELHENKLPLTVTIRETHEHILNGNRVAYDGHGADTHVIREPGTSISTPIGSEQKDETQTGGDSRSESQGKNASSDSYKEKRGLPPNNQEDYGELMKRYQPLMKWRSCANMVMSLQI